MNLVSNMQNSHVHAIPRCLVLMPCSTEHEKLDIDFEYIYQEAVCKAIIDAGMKPVRKDLRLTDGVIRQTTVEQLKSFDYVIADLTIQNPVVSFHLGVRHAHCASSTLTMTSNQNPTPFDVTYLPTFRYTVGLSGRIDSRELHHLYSTIISRMLNYRKIRVTTFNSSMHKSSAMLYERNLESTRPQPPCEKHLWIQELRNRLYTARNCRDYFAVSELERELGSLGGVDSEIIAELFFTHLELEKWESMVRCFEYFPLQQQKSRYLRWYLAIALFRSNQKMRALRTLMEVEGEFGASSELYGLAGGIHEELWGDALKRGEVEKAESYLRQSIFSYKKSFDADMRNINAGTRALILLEIDGSVQSKAKIDQLLPVVKYAAKQRSGVTQCTMNYDANLSQFEMAIVENDAKEAKEQLGKLLSSKRTHMQIRSLSRNIVAITRARKSTRRNHELLIACIDSIRRTHYNCVEATSCPEREVCQYESNASC